MIINLDERVTFESRHNGPSQNEIVEMLQKVGVPSVDALIGLTIPNKIRLPKELKLPNPKK